MESANAMTGRSAIGKVPSTPNPAAAFFFARTQKLTAARLAGWTMLAWAASALANATDGTRKGGANEAGASSARANGSNRGDRGWPGAGRTQNCRRRRCLRARIDVASPP